MVYRIYYHIQKYFQKVAFYLKNMLSDENVYDIIAYTIFKIKKKV